MFNAGDAGFPDRDLYVMCANASDGVITASPTVRGEQLQDLPPGKEVMRTATEGKINEISYWWPRPGAIKPPKKKTFYMKPLTEHTVSTKDGDQIFGIGYYE